MGNMNVQSLDWKAVFFYLGEFPSGQRGQTVNLLHHCFGGPNPPSPTTNKTL